METRFTDEESRGTHIISARNNDIEYLLWQLDVKNPDAIYFEFDDQANGKYDNVRECTITSDGCHIVLTSGQFVHFYWHPPGHPGLDSFETSLKALYSDRPEVM